MPIGVGIFSEDAILKKRQPGKFIGDEDPEFEDYPDGYKPGTTVDIPIRVVTSPPYLRGIFSEEREPTEADFRISGRLIFFVEPGIDVDTVNISAMDPSVEDIIIYNGQKYMVQAIWAAGQAGHSEVLCERQPEG